MWTELRVPVLFAVAFAWLSGCSSPGVQKAPVPPREAAAGSRSLESTDVALSARRQRERSEIRDLSSYFGGHTATFVGFDQLRGKWIRFNAARADQEFLPASTFKLPNALIALHLGVVSGPDFELKWDPAKAPPQPWWPDSWKQDHTLRSALKNSAFWYFQEIARRIGKERMAAYVKKLHYGNESIEGEIDSFWLRGGLHISANEQIAFLRRLHDEQLDVSPGAMRTLKAIMVLEERDGYKVSGKTGTIPVGQGVQLFWLVGYLEQASGVFYFAWNFESDGEFWTQERRLELTLSVLHDWGVLPAVAPRASFLPAASGWE